MVIYLVATGFRAAERPRAALSDGLLTIIDELQNIHGANYGVGLRELFIERNSDGCGAVVGDICS